MPDTVRLLNPPGLPDMALERSEVNMAIDNAMKKDVIFIHAPAGFGKTVAMSMWLSGKQKPAAWIPLTIYDDNPSVFCRYLLLALSGLDITIAGHVKEALEFPGFDAAPFEYLFRILPSITNINPGSVIVFDDFHLIENKEILKALPPIIKKLTPRYKFVILSRLNPPDCFSDMVVKGSIGEVSEDNLRFTKMQIVSLYRKCGIDLKPAEVADIDNKTGGWALGLGVLLISVRSNKQGKLYGISSGEQYINKYLKDEVWGKWNSDIKEFLLRTSILEDLPSDLCDEICGCDSRKMLSALMNNCGLVIQISDNAFRYHHILRDFLRQTAKELNTDLSRYYIMAADYMYKQSAFPAALDYYFKSEDSHALNRFLLNIVNYNSINANVEDCCNSFNNLLINKLPAETIVTNINILAPCVWSSLLFGNIDQFKFWLSKMNDYIENKKDIEPHVLAGIMLFQFPNPFIEINDLLKFKSKVFENFEFRQLPSPSITYNLPYFHRSHRDYSGIANDWESLIPELIDRFKAITGDVINLYMDGVKSGLLYEQNRIAEAREYALKACGMLTEKSHPEIRFSVQVHLALIYFAEEDEKSAWDILYNTLAMINENAIYLKKNMDAVITKYRLYKGDITAAKEWLGNYSVSESNEATLYQFYQVMATIRARISLGELTPAFALLSSAEKLAVDYRRPLDQIEVLILRSIAYWNGKKRTNALICIEKAVLLARPYGYIRMFANEGAAILPILQKLYNRISCKPEDTELSVFIKKIILYSSENAKNIPGIATYLDGKVVRLSKQQAHMLNLLSEGKNNRQICETTGLKLNTVKAHLYKLYEKLEVNNATDAVLEAHRLGILDKKV